MHSTFKTFIFTLLITICSTAHSSSSDDWKIWQTIEIEIIGEKVVYPLQKSLFFGSRSACERSLRGYFSFYPSGEIKQDFDKTLYFKAGTALSFISVNCVDRVVGEEFKNEMKRLGKIID